VQAGETWQELDDTLFALQEDYNRCVKVIRKSYSYLEQVGVKEFNKYSKYKWSLDRAGGYSYVCVRYGSSLNRKSLVKSSGLLEDAEIYQWIENKDLICEALDEECEYIRDKVKTLKRKMEETRNAIGEYEDKFNDLNEDLEEFAKTGGSKVIRPAE
jgi:hypothetical protein